MPAYVTITFSGAIHVLFFYEWDVFTFYSWDGMDKIKLFHYFFYILNYSSFYFIVFGSVCNKKVIRFIMVKHALVLTRNIALLKSRNICPLQNSCIFHHTHLITYNSLMNCLHTWTQHTFGQDLQVGHTKLDLEMTLTFKVKVTNFACFGYNLL